MFKKNIDFVKSFKPALIGYAIFFALSIILTVIFGINLDINFKGGTIITYSYQGELNLEDAEKIIEDTIDKPVDVSRSTGLAGTDERIVISLVGSVSLSTEQQKAIQDNLTKEYPDNKFELYDSNSVSPVIAGSFFTKSIVAVIIAGTLVVLYIGIRFRKIGGVSAAITAFTALFIDVLVAFFTCTILRLQIDSNFIAVVLTLFGYSLNDTIVIYDRIRENRPIYPKMSNAELVNISVNSVMSRTIVTAFATFVAVIMIVGVSEFFGLSTLRSFGIPMATGIISGCISTLFISTPLWVLWKNKMGKKKAK